MEYIPVLLSLLSVDLLAAMSPGPNFVVVTQTALQRSRRLAFAVVLGVAAANLTWCGAVAFGLSALFDLVPRLFGAIRLAGGAYLVYLGVRLWRSTDGSGGLAGGPRQNGGGSRADGARRAPPTPDDGLRGAFLRGLFTNLTNPKSLVYFGSVFTLFVRPGTPTWVQAAAVSVVLADTLLWYGAVAACFSRSSVRRTYRAIAHLVDRAAGAVMIAFGARLIVVRD